MKSLIKAAVVATIAIPVFSYAQSSQTLTRAQVRSELVQLEKAGYNPNVDEDYPGDLQHAELTVANQKSDVSGYGPGTAGAAQSGQ
ncbi:DUF4148 domain-containing protein [Paraburkholderia sp.]|uniref:DUF4148 domain-containing protein n=1 Tax=Paraburkholderia sp. TaxID=1926495 RepID=UPI00239C3AD4|nr:DUF4148 domain-containing protein [Paraburkholderia sp.]MDE1180931.1 DUF4148 domain-containing protein [Paraburkholderia sp.]